MFILNNIHGRDHKGLYPQSGGQGHAIFDITEKQVNSIVNSDWKEMRIDDLVCVVGNSYKISTIYKINTIDAVGLAGEGYGEIILVKGEVVGKPLQDLQYDTLLRRHEVKHERLNNYQFCNGFNVANLGSQLDSLKLKSKVNANTLGELKSILCS